MASLDFEPANRLEAAKNVIADFIAERPYDKIGLVIFSSEAFSMTPLTLDHNMLDRSLDEAARAFVNDPARNGFDARTRVAHLSAIFDWYEEDFLAEADSLLAWVARYVDDPELASGLARGDAWTVRYLDYDWTLNGDR